MVDRTDRVGFRRGIRPDRPSPREKRHGRSNRCRWVAPPGPVCQRESKAQPMMRSAEGRSRIEQGFTLVELLVALLIAMTVVAAVLGVASQGQRIFRAQTDQADLQQRARVAVDVLRQDLLMAGAGTYAG